jgi:cellulose synthase/poly-beta-1,6-N-acetylglucosamine synthase-like glycosyltransferase
MTSQPRPEQRIGNRPDPQPGGQPSGELGRHLDQQLDLSINTLRRTRPDYSAHVTATRKQQVSIVAFVVVVVALFVLWPIGTAQVLLGVLTLLYACTIAFRLWLVLAGSRGDHRISVSDDEALRVPAEELPVYSVLVPAYREPSVIGELMEHLAALDYPRGKLDVQLLLEADDRETITAAEAALPGPHVRITVVPPSQPRTKPKACNYGLAFARGELVTIYDAEDRPEPLQLRRAAVAMRRLGPSHACVQAELGYFNSTQNRITRWFSLEYATWFRSLLPGLVALRMPVPLGGTSNHFRASILRDLGAWDPYNVTEDADLGIRLARLGYGVGVLDSVTLEEANSDFINWIKQRSRWYKGYLLTWLVHMRTPRTVVRQLGWRGFLALNLFVGGTPLSTLVNPLFWVLTLIWLISQPSLIEQLFVAPVYYVGLVCMVFGNATVVYLNLMAARDGDRPDLVAAALTSPFYWLMMSVAAAKAAFQLVFQPTYWEKTTHGLNLEPARAHTGADNAD